MACIEDRVRRRLLGAMAGAVAWTVAPARAARGRIVVLTSYPDELVSRFKSAFEAANPDAHLDVLWRKSGDALPLLREPRQGGVDVFWAASPRTFSALAREGGLQRLAIDRSGLPERIGNTRLDDADGYYIATELAGYGLALHPGALARLGLARPRDWTDLTDPRWAGQLALPTPAQVGYAPPIVEIVLQAYGWDPGWALWSEIVGNATLVDVGASAVTESVASGRHAAGVTIDFFAATAISGGAPLEFVYPAHDGVNPAHIAITRDAANRQGGQSFVEFVLSDAGQRILAAPEVRRLPVRPSAYRGLPAGQFDPYAAAARGELGYDEATARPRMGVSTAVFQQFLVAGHDDLARLWARVHRAESAGVPPARLLPARQLLARPPIGEAEADSVALRQAFRERRDGPPGEIAGRREADWRASSERNRAEVAALLDQAAA